MKNTKHKLIPIVSSSLLAVMLVIAPVATFARGNDKGENNGKAKSMLMSHLASNPSNPKSNSIFNRILAFLAGERASASTTTTTVVNNTPSISGIKSPTVLKTGAEGTWTVKASDPQNGSLEYAVDWGEATSATLRSMATTEPVFVQTSTFTHTYANGGTYTVKFTVKNDAGLQASSSVTVHVVGQATQTAPVISNVATNNITSEKAIISWDTDVNADSAVWYSKTTPVNTTVDPNISRDGKTKNHVIKLKDLDANTKYYVVVGSENNSGMTMSSEISFTTLPEKTDANTPVITSVTGNATVVAGDTEIVTVNAFDPKNTDLSYSADWGDTGLIRGMALMATPEDPFVQTATFEHVYSNAGTYTATFTVENDAGLTTSATKIITVTAAPDTTAPVITNVSVGVVSSTSATITWTTDEASTSKVFYSTTTPVDVTTATSASDSTVVTSHSLQLTGLTANTTYHFIVKSSDAANNAGSSTEATFTTSA